VKDVVGLVRGTDWTGEPLLTVPADANNADAGNPLGGSTLTAQADIFNDVAGNSAALIDGLDGDDTIYGRDGNDVVEGNLGADTIYGGSGDDKLYGDPEDAVDNGSLGDTLYGGDGNDIVAGMVGDDVIVGGHGKDTLNGLEGADRYVFNDIHDSAPSAMDTIDWQGADTLDFSKFDFDANTAGLQGRANPSANLIVNGAAPSSGMVEDTFYYNAATGVVSLSTDTDELADFAVTLNVVPEDIEGPIHPISLSANDFLI
jgi:Ca2+-binding RTX toxin-like protein